MFPRLLFFISENGFVTTFQVIYIFYEQNFKNIFYKCKSVCYDKFVKRKGLQK